MSSTASPASRCGRSSRSRSRSRTVPGEETCQDPALPDQAGRHMCARQVDPRTSMVDFTPEIHAKAAQDLDQEVLQVRTIRCIIPRWSPIPMAAIPVGAIWTTGPGGGGTNWPGAGFDPDTQVVVRCRQLHERLGCSGLVPLPEGLSDLKYDEGVRRAGVPHQCAGPGFGSASDAPKVSADDQKLAAALAAHPQHAVGPPPPRSVDGIPLVQAAIRHRSLPSTWTTVRFRLAGGRTAPRPTRSGTIPALKGVNIPQDRHRGAGRREAITKTLVVPGRRRHTSTAAWPSARRLSARA
jgi:hypothetical protein